MSFTATLDGAQELPPVDTAAIGHGTFLFDKRGRRVVYAIAFSGLGSHFAAAHFHHGAPGQDGRVFKHIRHWNLSADGTSGTVSGVWKNMTKRQVRAFAKGDVHVDVHTVDIPRGEIRGQVVFIV